MTCPNCDYNDTLHKLRQNVWMADEKKLEDEVIQLKKIIRTMKIDYEILRMSKVSPR